MFRNFIALALIIPCISGCSGTPQHAKDFLLMDTFVRIEIRDWMSEEQKLRIVDRVIERMRKLERQFNYFSKDGELAIINNLRKDEDFTLSPEMFQLLRRAKELRGQTGGLFDVTMGRESWSWGLNGKKGTIYFRITGVKIDLGGIAKGFIVDEGVSLLKDMGVKNALINAGGDIYCMGGGYYGEGWRVGIKNPLRPWEVAEVLTLRDRGVATSGGYERFDEVDGERLSRIIDPRTQKPVRDTAKSVTVVADDCTTADALATALYVLSPRQAIALIHNFPEADCIIIDRHGLTYASSGFPKGT